MIINLENQVALVTGASRGLGKAIALSFANNGANVAINYIGDEERNAQLVKEEICEHGGTAIIVEADVTDESAVQKMVNKTLDRFGKIDILVNNAGVHQHIKSTELTISDWRHVIDINLTGNFICAQAVLISMLKNAYGRIINMTSLDAFAGTDHESHYGASKAGQVGFTKALALEVASKNITVNGIAPGNIVTPMLLPISQEREQELRKKIPVGRLGQPEDVAHAALFLASKEASFVTGEIVHVNGGIYLA